MGHGCVKGKHSQEIKAQDLQQLGAFLDRRQQGGRFIALRRRRMGIERDSDSGAVDRVSCFYHTGNKLLVASVDTVKDADGHVTPGSLSERRKLAGLCQSCGEFGRASVDSVHRLMTRRIENFAWMPGAGRWIVGCERQKVAVRPIRADYPPP